MRFTSPAAHSGLLGYGALALLPRRRALRALLVILSWRALYAQTSSSPSPPPPMAFVYAADAGYFGQGEFNFGGASFTSGCEEPSHSYSDQFFSSTKTAGQSSVTATLTTMVHGPTLLISAGGNDGGFLYVYALGPPGTPFHLQKSWSGNASVNVSVGGQDGWSATATDFFTKTVTAQVPALQTGGQQATDSDSVPLDGTTQPSTMTCFGNTYSLAVGYRLGAGAFSGSDPTQEQGEAQATSTLTVTGTANTPTNAIKLVSIDDTDPNNPQVSFTVTGSVGSINWGLDGNVTQGLGTLPAGTYRFTVANIEGLAHSPHLLEIIGTNGQAPYADATWLDTSLLPDQSFSNTWQIAFLNLSHNSITANGTISKSQILWGLPGQQYDRYLSSTSVVLTSFLPADAPEESRTTAAPGLVVNGVEHLMQEIPSIGSPNFWAAAFGACPGGVLGACSSGGPLLLDVFLHSGAAAQFKLSGFTSTFDKYWMSSPWIFATLPRIFYGLLNLTIN